MHKRGYDAVVVGSGPNGLAAAITLRLRGLAVLLVEARATVGGGMRSAELTLPGYVHDVCSAIHPMAAASPFFGGLPLEQHGLAYIHPPVLVAHPFDDGTASALRRSLPDTARSLREDERAYMRLMAPLVGRWDRLVADILGPPGWPRHPGEFARFGLHAMAPALTSARRFLSVAARGLWAGLAAHGVLPFSKIMSSAVGLVLAAAGHVHGWPLVRGGSQNLANALAGIFASLGGEIQLGQEVASIDALPASRAVLLDVTPRQALRLAGHRFTAFYRWQLGGFRYGPGVFKMDWALADPIPFTAPECREAGTVHLGNTLEEIAAAEAEVGWGRHPERPFVLLAQPTRFDPSRAPAGRHTAWAYCHVPPGSERDMTKAIEQQVERFAPGFRERILGRHTMNTRDMTAYNPNYVGGDINGGVVDLGQSINRPALRPSPYRTSARGVYLCSASTPPGGGVHGQCGTHAARTALADLFD